MRFDCDKVSFPICSVFVLLFLLTLFDCSSFFSIDGSSNFLVAAAVKGDPYAYIQEAQKQQAEREAQLLKNDEGKKGGKGNSKKSKTAPLPNLPKLLAQNFYVSVISSTFGNFNATLRIKSAVNFPERLTGELVPHNDAVVSEGKELLPHFKRERKESDDDLVVSLERVNKEAAGSDPLSDNELYVSEVMYSPETIKKLKKKKKVDAAEYVPKPTLRPTLLYFEVQFKHAEAKEGEVQVYLVPAGGDELINFKIALEEGSAVPWMQTSFSCRADEKHLTENLVQNVAGLARSCSASFPLGQSSGGAQDETKDEIHPATGRFTLRFFSEYDVSLQVSYPSSKKEGGTSSVWLYGYTNAKESVYNRNFNDAPVWMQHVMLGIAMLGFIVQFLQGDDEGRRRAALKQQAATLKQQQQQQQLAQSSQQSESASGEKKNQ